jgi:beta-glucosidase
MRILIARARIGGGGKKLPLPGRELGLDPPARGSDHPRALAEVSISTESRVARIPMKLLLPLALLPFLAPQEPAAKVHTALAPAERLAEGWWKERFEATNKRLAEGDVGLLFLGDSITQGWEGEGKAVWDEFFAPRKAVNLGFSGDRTQHVLWRLERHGLEALAARAPRLAVLMIGTNNSNGADNTAEEIADGIRAVVSALAVKLPDTKVLLLAIFPRGAEADAQRAKNARASQLASRIADGKRVHYLDIGAVFLGEYGSTLTRELMPDYLHLSPLAYGLWAEAIEPKVKELLGEGVAPKPAGR